METNSHHLENMKCKPQLINQQWLLSCKTRVSELCNGSPLADKDAALVQNIIGLR